MGDGKRGMNYIHENYISHTIGVAVEGVKRIRKTIELISNTGAVIFQTKQRFHYDLNRNPKV